MLGTTLEVEGARLVEPILGWRTWALAGSKRGDGLMLLPVAGRGRPWQPRRAARAVCPLRRTHGPVPGLDCRCGLHATREIDLLRRTRDPAVLGRVALWGRVVEHERGYRAELAYPQRLRLVCHLCLWRWGGEAPSRCEVVTRGRGGRMVPLCGPHAELSERYGCRLRHRLDASRVEGALLSTYAVDLLP